MLLAKTVLAKGFIKIFHDAKFDKKIAFESNKCFLIVSFTNPIASGLVKLNTSVFVSCVTLEECKSLMQTQNDQNLLYESSSKFKIKYLYFIVSLL